MADLEDSSGDGSSAVAANHDRNGQIGAAIDELSRATRLLTRSAYSVVAFTIITFLLMTFALVQRSQPFLYISSEVLATLCIFTAAASIFSAFEFDRVRKIGDATYEELSDELQWDLHQSIAVGRTKRPNLVVRQTLRRFVSATRLPLAPGLYGAAFYSVVNLTFTAVAIAVLVIRPAR